MAERNKVDWLPGLLGPLALRILGLGTPKLRTTVDLDIPGLTVQNNNDGVKTDIAINADTFVRAGLAGATANIAVNSKKITGLANSSDPADAVNRSQLDDAVDTLTDYIDTEIAGVGGGGAPWSLTSDVTGTLPVANGGTGITSIGSGMATWWGTPTSANLYSALSTKTGSGYVVFQDSPTFKTNIQINNPANTFAYFLTPGAISANRTVNLPVLAGTDTLVCEAFAQALTNKTINCASNTVTNIDNSCISNSAGIAWGKLASGAANLPAVTSFVTTVDAKCTLKSREPVHVQTTDATQTTLDSFTLGSETSSTVTWTVTGVKSDGSQMAGYSVTACFKNDGGTLTQVGTTVVTVLGESDAAWDCTIDNSGTTIRLRVTGKAATTIQWGAAGSSLEVIP